MRVTRELFDESVSIDKLSEDVSVVPGPATVADDDCVKALVFPDEVPVVCLTVVPVE